MVSTVKIQDKTGISNTGFFWELPVSSEILTVEELIKIRVFEEVEYYNAHQSDLFRGLVQPTDAEKTLNGYKFKRKKLYWEEQFEVATEAFKTNGFLILVDNQQVTELDDVIQIEPETSITFLRLIPLVGG